MTDYTHQIATYCRANPDCQIQDVFKYLYQSIFGCEHLLTDEAAALARIRAEADTAPADTLPTVEPLADGWCRLHLSVLGTGLSPETLCRLFLLSSQWQDPEALERLAKLNNALTWFTRLARFGSVPFTETEVSAAVAAWQAQGCPACSHSPAFRGAYHPAYRVIRSEYLRLLPLLTAIDTRLAQNRAQGVTRPLTVAIEGRCAGGKTTLAALLQRVYDCNLLHMDDFFLTPSQRTPARLATPGENIDHERFLSQVLAPLAAGQPVEYIRYDCHTDRMLSAESLPPKPLAIIEGVYSLHPDLAPYYGLKVFLQVSAETQCSRILLRNTAAVAKMFFDRWIPLEEQYFTGCGVEKLADIVVPE